MVRKQSFLSNLLGCQEYKELRIWAKLIVPIGAGILILLYLLSSFFHSGIIKYLLNLTNGTSLLFIVYVLFFVVLLDIEVDVEEKEKNYWEDEKKAPKPFKYKLTIVWGVVLLSLGIVAIYYSNKYRNHYAFECETYLVDEENGIYHLGWDIDCGALDDVDYLEPMKGYQINESFKFCENCEEMLDEAESETGMIYARP